MQDLRRTTGPRTTGRQDLRFVAAFVKTRLIHPGMSPSAKGLMLSACQFFSFSVFQLSIKIARKTQKHTKTHKNTEITSFFWGGGSPPAPCPPFPIFASVWSFFQTNPNHHIRKSFIHSAFRNFPISRVGSRRTQVCQKIPGKSDLNPSKSDQIRPRKNFRSLVSASGRLSFYQTNPFYNLRKSFKHSNFHCFQASRRFQTNPFRASVSTFQHAFIAASRPFGNALLLGYFVVQNLCQSVQFVSDHPFLRPLTSDP